MVVLGVLWMLRGIELAALLVEQVGFDEDTEEGYEDEGVQDDTILNSGKVIDVSDSDSGLEFQGSYKKLPVQVR